MNEVLITAIVYTEINEEVGPRPISWIPSSLSDEDLIHVGIKTITILTAEQGMIPKTLSFIPFPSLNLKAIVKYLQWHDDERRGFVGNGAISLLFNEANDIIFYKYISDLEHLFENAAQKIVKIEESKGDKEEISSVLKNLVQGILYILEQMQIKEAAAMKLQAFPAKAEDGTDLFHYQYKVIICGDPMVGKTSTILRFTDQAFKRSYLPTLGVSVSKRIVNIGNAIIQLILWDIAGQQKFETMRTQFYSGAKGMLLVFDLTSPPTFNSITKWYEDVKNFTSENDHILGYILGNKNDLTEDRKLDRTRAIQTANKLNLDYFETSALTGDNIETAFFTLAKTLYMLNK